MMKSANRFARPTAGSWDGPLYRPFQLGETCEDYSQRRTPLFLEAVDPEGVWIYTLSGYAYYELGAELHILSAGTVLAIRHPDSGWLERVAKGSPWRYLWIHVAKGPALEMFSFIQRQFGFLQQMPPQAATVRQARALINLAVKQPRRSEHFWSRLTFEWLDTWWQDAHRYHQDGGKPLPAVPQKQQQIFTPDSVKSFARRMGYSRSYLTRKLTREWHESPGKVFRRARLNEASRLLRETDLPVERISRLVGFAAVTSFCRSFRRRFKYSPRVYRSKNRQ